MSLISSKNTETSPSELLGKPDQYQNLFKHANDAILIIEPENETVLKVNDKACEMYGFELEDFIGLSLKSISKDVGYGDGQRQKLFEVGTHREFETVQFRSDGTPLNLQINAAVIEYEGRPAILSINRDITERRQAESRLLLSEANLAAAQRITHLGSWEIELSDLKRINNNKVRWSDEVYRIFGYEPDKMDVSINYYFDAVHPSDRKQVRRAFIEAVSYRKKLNIEYRIILPDGSERFQHGQGEVIYDGQSNQPLKFIGTVQDITECNRAEEKIRESEQWLRAILDASRDGIVIEDVSQITYINDSYTKMLGYDQPEELVGKNISEFLPPEEAERLSEYGRRRLRGEQAPSVYEFRAKRKDGTLIEVEGAVSTSVIGGKRYIMTAIRDITERKQAADLLQKNLSLLSSTFEATADGILVVDLDDNVVAFNKKLVEMWQIPEEFVKSRDKVGAMNFVFKQVKNADAIINSTEKLKTNPGKEHSDLIEFLDGRVFERYSHAQLQDGKVNGRVVSFRDITERRRAEAALRESEYKLRTLVSSMNEGLLQVDAEDFIVFVNKCFSRMVEYSEEELIGKNWSHLLLDDEGREFIREVNKRRRSGISDRYELRLKKKSGETLYAMVGGVPVLESEGSVSGSMGVFTDITERKRAEDQLLHDAFHDGLTGLANRALFMDHLRMTIERGKSRHSNSYAVLFLDFDRFKVINDSLGHTEGDNLLKLIARRIEAATRTGDLVARLGGDEFVILLSELLEQEDAVEIAERIQTSFKNPFALGGGEVFISASIGIALSATGHKRAEDMLRDADIAMYRAKAKGKACYQVFDRAMHEYACKQLQLETELRRALEQKEFELHYQPIINLETETLTGFEALVRWNHPTLGMIPPFEFISAAEENGLILPLGEWILQESCRQLREWQSNSPAAENLTISVNLSSKQFSQIDLTGQIAATLEKTGLDPQCLKLEITESHVMENSEQTVVMMDNLRALGVELILDDFGTGYSSLSYLHRLPVSYLKIDRSFVMRMIENEENAEIVSTIVKLAQNLKMKVVAEGIETREQLTHLKNLHCEFGQGYFFSKPLDCAVAQIFIDSYSGNLAYMTDLQIINAEFKM